MKMKHLCTLILSATAVLAGTAHASDGTIHFTGTISSQTCKITEASPTVTLPAVAVTALGTKGALSGHTPFALSLTGCAPNGKVHTYFEPGSTIDATTGYLINSGSAKNVQVALQNSDSSEIQLGKPDGSQGSKTADIDGQGNATLGYSAEYYATDAAEAGDVKTQVEYSMVYE